MNNPENGQKEFTMEQKHASRKKKKAGAAKKIVIIALSAVVILGGAAALIINHYLNRIQKIDIAAETTLSPSEFWELIDIDPSAQPSDSLESDVETEPVTTEETLPQETTDTETEQESATEDTERLIVLDPEATDVVGIKETTTAAPTTKKTQPPTTSKPQQTTAAYVPNNYNWTKASPLGDDYLINILLIGDDSRTDSRSRSDTILLLSINPNKNKASLITFMRDMYVPIHDGYGSSRINHAYEAGGVGFLTECLNMNFGLHIDGVVKVNFWGFVKAVDILGGVDISLTENEVKMMKDDYIDISGNGKTPSFHSGSCHLDGNAALAYCRIRSLDNDYNRTARQRKMLTTLFNKVKSSGAGTLQNLANSVLSCCQTTMSNGTMAG